MNNKRKLYSILAVSFLLLSSCGKEIKCSNANDFSEDKSNTNDSSNEEFEHKSGYYFCDIKDHSYYDGRLEHKYYIYTDLFKNNQSITYDKTGEIKFKITFYHQLDYDFFYKLRNPNCKTKLNPFAFQYRFKNDQNYQGTPFYIEDGMKIYQEHFRNLFVEKFCEHKEKDYTLDVSISIDKLLKHCNYESTPVYIIPCFNATEDGYYYQANGFRYELIDAVDGVNASFYLEVNEDSISIRDMK